MINFSATLDYQSFGKPALHWAIIANSLEAAQLLLSRGTNPNIKDDHGFPPLSFVRSREAVELLLKGGADSSCKDSGGISMRMSIRDPLVRELL